MIHPVPPTLTAALMVLTGALLAGVWSAAVADAASLTNRDKREYSLEIRAGGRPEGRVLKPGETIRNICPSGCSISWGSGNDYQIEAADEVSIEDGFMYYDAAPSGPSTSSPPGVPSLRPGR